MRSLIQIFPHIVLKKCDYRWMHAKGEKQKQKQKQFLSYRSNFAKQSAKPTNYLSPMWCM